MKRQHVQQFVWIILAQCGSIIMPVCENIPFTHAEVACARYNLKQRPQTVELWKTGQQKTDMTKINEGKWVTILLYVNLLVI